MQRDQSYLANNYRVTLINGHSFDSVNRRSEKSEVSTCGYQVTALITDTHKQADSKFIESRKFPWFLGNS
jgi:hypothetical protein